jgi:uncharacterized protein
MEQKETPMKSIKFMNGSIEMSGNLFLPEGVSESKKYPAIPVVHPGGGVKEQTAGLYADKLAAEGFVTLAFDASYQGASGGEPRQLENPSARVEDISAAIDYLTALPYVDRDRIGVLGICAGGGYAVNATMNDRRIKALGTVSAYNFGAVLRHGWYGTDKVDQAFKSLEMAAKARTDEANGQKIAYSPLTPAKREDAPNADMVEAYEYYHTPRGQWPDAPSIAPVRSLAQLVNYDAFYNVETFLTQPIQIIAGSKAGSRWMSEDVYKRAASKEKNLHIVEGASHVGLYDKPDLVGEAMSKLGPFFKKNLMKQEGSLPARA